MFGYTYNAAIKNLGIEDVNIMINGRFTYVGALIGNQSYGTITNCYSTGKVTSPSTYSDAYICTGGLVGKEDQGIITNSYSNANVSSSNPSSWAR